MITGPTCGWISLVTSSESGLCRLKQWGIQERCRIALRTRGKHKEQVSGRAGTGPWSILKEQRVDRLVDLIRTTFESCCLDHSPERTSDRFIGSHFHFLPSGGQATLTLAIGRVEYLITSVRQDHYGDG
jgi:hypothetical protein